MVSQKDAVSVFSYILESRKGFPYLFNSNDISTLISYAVDAKITLHADVIAYCNNPEKRRDIDNQIAKTKQQNIAFRRAFREISPDYIAQNSLGEEQVVSNIEEIISNTEGWEGLGLHMNLMLKNASKILNNLDKEGVKREYGRICHKCIHEYGSTVQVRVNAENPETMALLKDYVVALSTRQIINKSSL